MRIRFERSGGFANISLKAEIDSAELPPERAKELSRLVAKARPFDQPAQPATTCKEGVGQDSLEHPRVRRTDFGVSDGFRTRNLWSHSPAL